MWDIVATTISIIALLITFFQTQKSNKLAKEANYIANKPKIKLSSIIIEPSKIEVYGGGKILLPSKLTEEHVGIIKNNYRSLNTVYFNNVPYVLFNSCDKNTKENKIGLIIKMNPMSRTK